ncbi:MULTISPECIES: hypothetical protein, partial [unclassified Enterobacter]|uniref:hypothetical protein n=1 Tax=unclassified Enterobacter TaxID=2608935 RepID=UPI00292B7DF1
MMSLWDALRMNMMISYQELVRTFLRFFTNLGKIRTSCNSIQINLKYRFINSNFTDSAEA